jgi:hypothetical protein
MGETTTVERSDLDRSERRGFRPATFDESVVDTSPEIEATKANIEHTRAEMSETINAIKDHCLRSVWSRMRKKPPRKRSRTRSRKSKKR